MKYFGLMILITVIVACSPGRKTVANHLIDEAQIEDIESFALDDNANEAYEMPDGYSSRFTGSFADIGNKSPVSDFVQDEDDIDEDPEIDFIDERNPEATMAMFGDSDETKRLFYVKSAEAVVFKYKDDRSRKAVKILKKGQRIRAKLENGQAKIGDKYYMSLSDLSLTPLRRIRNVRASQK